MSQVQLAIRLLDGQSKRLEFPATATLADVRAALGPQPAAFVFSTTFPTHRFTPEEERATLADSKLAPKAALTLQTAERREQQHSTEPPPAAPGVVHAVTSSQQLKSLQQGGKPVVVDFFAVWCGPCQRFKPTFAAMAKEYAGRVTFAAVDVDEAQELAQEFKVAAMPTFVVVSGGREVGRVKGADEGALRRLLP